MLDLTPSLTPSLCGIKDVTGSETQPKLVARKIGQNQQEGNRHQASGNRGKAREKSRDRESWLVFVKRRLLLVFRRVLDLSGTARHLFSFFSSFHRLKGIEDRVVF